ncbi:MAG: hypothetical protein AAGA30_12760 [Planctomycetota bacterium]
MAFFCAAGIHICEWLDNWLVTHVTNSLHRVVYVLPMAMLAAMSSTLTTWFVFDFRPVSLKIPLITLVIFILAVVFVGFNDVNSQGSIYAMAAIYPFAWGAVFITSLPLFWFFNWQSKYFIEVNASFWTEEEKRQLTQLIHRYVNEKNFRFNMKQIIYFTSLTALILFLGQLDIGSWHIEFQNCILFGYFFLIIGLLLMGSVRVVFETHHRILLFSFLILLNAVIVPFTSGMFQARGINDDALWLMDYEIIFTSAIFFVSHQVGSILILTLYRSLGIRWVKLPGFRHRTTIEQYLALSYYE